MCVLYLVRISVGGYVNFVQVVKVWMALTDVHFSLPAANTARNHVLVIHEYILIDLTFTTPVSGLLLSASASEV